jgi:glycosyltransferase involved in cell wall biosynthesis
MTSEASAQLAARSEQASLRRVVMVAWRDLADPEAGGSELHSHEIARRWAAAGISVTLRTSSVAGEPELVERDGYRVLRRSGRYQVFATAPADIVSGRLGAVDGIVEIWNGMPFFSPVWSRMGALHGRTPRLTFLHHVHGEMWRMVLPPRLAAIGETIESRIAPPFYRYSSIVTLSESSRREIVEMLRLPPSRIRVVPPGIDGRYVPGGERSPTPLIVAVGRLVPVKRFDRLIRVVAELHERHSQLECLILGEGSERSVLEELRHELGADGFVHLPGRLADEEVLAAYRRAWVLASTSVREGWGMTVSEAAACGTPAVVSDIAGHRDVVIDGESGYLADGHEQLLARLHQVLTDDALRQRFSKGAVRRASELSWDTTARQTFDALADEVVVRRQKRWINHR